MKAISPLTQRNQHNFVNIFLPIILAYVLRVQKNRFIESVYLLNLSSPIASCKIKNYNLNQTLKSTYIWRELLLSAIGGKKQKTPNMKLRNIVATMKIVHSIKKPPKLNYANMPVDLVPVKCI